MSALALDGYPDMPGFDKATRELVYAMIEAGWTGRRTSKGHWLGKAPDGKTTITVPSKTGNGRGFKNTKAQFARWLREQLTPEEQALIEGIEERGEFTEADDQILNGIAVHNSRRLFGKAIEAETSRLIDRVVEGIENGEIIVEPLIRPYLARKHAGKDGGTRYESQTTLERIWPGGNTDYVCALEGCGYESRNARSVAMHYGQQHTRKGETEPAGTGPHHLDPDYTEPLTSREYRPTERLVRTLTEVILELQGMAPADMARELLTWLHDRPDIEHETRPLVPLTDKQILDKIRLLVGQPDQSEEIEGLRQENLNLANEVTRLKEERQALRELLTDGE